MQLGGRRPLPDPSDLAEALRAAASLGHRPAVTVITPARREEQGFASLAQWAAKGAHLLEMDLGLGPGSRLLVSGPPAWSTVAVCLAAWWAGITVVTEPDGADAGVLHEDREPVPDLEILWVGDSVDGSPLAAGRAPAYAVEVQAFPDQPPPARAAASLTALLSEGTSWDQRDLLAHARSWGPDGVLGLTDAAPITTWVPAVAVRPLLVGRPTVVLRGATHDAAAAEGVSRWL